MRRLPAILLLATVLPPAAAAQEFNLGVTPPVLEAGWHDPGSTFYTDFRVFTTSDRPISVSMDARTGTLREFRQLRPASADRFSAQPCTSCVSPLSGGRLLTRRDRALTQRRDINRWSDMPFLVQLPPDIEPGYHLLQVTPRPEMGGSASTVNVVSTASIPVIFRVPGQVERAGSILGIHAAGTRHGRHMVETTFHNTGTVTVHVSTTISVHTPRGNVTIDAGERRVAPGTTATFTGHLPVDAVRGRTVYATADFGTGTTSAAAVISDTTQEQRTPPVPHMIVPLLALIAVSAATLWVVRRG